MKYLVVSTKHHLHHVGKWLIDELGRENVGIASLKEPFHNRAWEGVVERVRLPKRRGDETWEEWVRRWAMVEGVGVVTDNYRLSALGVELGARPPTAGPQSAIALGAWFNGETFTGAHWVFRDWGLWPGGMGPRELGGVTLVSGGRLPMEALEGHRAALTGFNGLVAVDLAWDVEGGGWRSGRLTAGWPHLHAQTWLWAQPSAAAALEGKPAPMPPFVVGVPACVPPYPFTANGLTSRQLVVDPERLSQLVLFDAALTNQNLVTAGLDGLVALACGRGNTLAAARQSALAALPIAEEGGARLDAGAAAEAALVDLERVGWY